MHHSREKESFYCRVKELFSHPCFPLNYVIQTIKCSLLLAVFMQLPTSAAAQSEKLSCKPTDTNTSHLVEKRSSNSTVRNILSDPNIRHCKKSDEEIKRIFQSKKVTVVDVQEPRNFSQAHIEDSINIPEYSIKAKSFLKMRPVAVVGEGFNDYRNFETCLDLLSHGFQEVTVLEGGVRRWLHLLKPQTADGSQHAVPYISPRDVFVSMKTKDWMIVTVDRIKKQQLLNLFPDRKVVGIDTFLKGYMDFESKGKFLFVSNDGEGYSKYKELLRDWGVTGSFWLEGGFQGFSLFSRNRNIMLTKMQRVNVRKSGCGL